MRRFQKLALALAIAALVLAVVVDAKKEDKEEKSKVTTTVPKAARHPAKHPVSHASPAKGATKLVKGPNPESMLPDMRKVSNPGKPKAGKEPKQHTVTTVGPTPVGHRAQKKQVQTKTRARKDEHPPQAQAPKKKQTQQKGVYKKKFPTVYKDRDAKVHTNMPKKVETKVKIDTATMQDIINNPTKHKGVKVNNYSGPAHAQWAQRKLKARSNGKDKSKANLLAVTAPKPAAAQSAKTQPISTRKRPAAMTPKKMAQEKREADKARAAKVLKHEQEKAKQEKKKEAGNMLKTAETKKVEAAKQHLETKAKRG